MGFLRKEKSQKTYTFKEVTKLINTQGYENYVAIQLESGKYLFVPEQRETVAYNAHKEFVNRMSNNGAYTNNRSFNNYQQTRGYRKSRNFGER